MCRILMCDRKGFSQFDKQYGMLKELNHLEKECGGHGNGYFLVKGGKCIKLEKGVNLTNRDIYNKVKHMSFDYFVYHTRIASVGNISDKNCHPFFNEDKSMVLCMNGTERSAISDLADGLDITDTEYVMRMFDEMKLPTKLIEELDSRYMFLRDGKVHIKNTQYGGLELIKYKDVKGFIVASSFPFVEGVKTMNYGLWTQGEPLLGRKKESTFQTFKTFQSSKQDTTKTVYKSSYTFDCDFNCYDCKELDCEYNCNPSYDYEKLQYGNGIYGTYEEESTSTTTSDNWLERYEEKKKTIMECFPDRD